MFHYASIDMTNMIIIQGFTLNRNFFYGNHIPKKSGAGLCHQLTLKHYIYLYIRKAY